MPKNVSLEALARFALLEGADRLIDAFSGIPEGPLRDSVISHAEVIRDTYAAAPPRAQAPDPLGKIGARAPKPPPKALPGPGPKTNDPKLKAVQMRLEGMHPPEIADKLKLRIGVVYEAIGEARKAGVQFPDIGRGKLKKDQKSTTYLMSMDQITDAKLMASAKRAADSRGIEVEEFLDRRRIALEMAQAGRHIRAIIAATKEERVTLSQWFTIARNAGHKVPFMLDESYVKVVEEPNIVTPAPPPPEVVDLAAARKTHSRRTQVNFAMTVADYKAGSKVMRHAIEEGAKALDVDVPEYLRRRREAITLLDRDVPASQVAQTVGVSKKQVENWRNRAAATGAAQRAKA